MYDPTVTRFTSEDPKGFGAGDPNLYRYVGNNPTNFTDPSGMQPPKKPSGFHPPNRESAERRSQLTNQWLNSGGTGNAGDVYTRQPLYASDPEYKKLVDELRDHIATSKPDLPTPKTRQNPVDYWPDLRDDQLPTPLSPEEYKAWQLERNRLTQKISDYAYQASRRATSRINRFTLGGLKAGAKIGDGLMEIVGNPDKAIEGVYNLATDSKTQQKVIDAIVEKLSDDDAENCGEIVVDIVVTAGAVGGAVKGGKVVVNVTKEGWRTLKASGPKAKELLQRLWKDEIGSIPGGPIPAPGGGLPKRTPLTATEVDAIKSSLRAETAQHGLFERHHVQFDKSPKSQMVADFDPKTGTIQVVRYNIADDIQGHHLSDLFFEEVVTNSRTGGRTVTEIRGTPADSNLQALLNPVTGEIDASRIALTPWARSLDKLGFTTRFENGIMISTPKPGN